MNFVNVLESFIPDRRKRRRKAGFQQPAVVRRSG